jgi:methylenetetrahydrofolate dehydrogenase (NADP+)/methenyltetrahydrofolate cyclohydrolase
VTARLLDGKTLALTVRDEVAAGVAALTPRLGRPPGLDVVLVGDDPASQVYVRNKQRAAEAAGFRSSLHRLPADATERDVLAVIDRLNEDPAVDGILAQLPLPRPIREDRVIERIDPLKDVDGLHPENAGLLAIGRPRFAPCTPLGVMRLLSANAVVTNGAHAVVLSRSNLVGKPMALLLLQKSDDANATVTVVHTGTVGPEAIARQADILIVAIGRPEVVGASWVKPGATVIDVGTHRREDGSLCGDVRFDEVATLAGAITPVPGGVGPMTVAMLLENTLKSARLRADTYSS